MLSETGELTYRELNERANRLARHLRSLGAGAGRVVAVCLERGPDQITALLAALKAGAAYLPLDPELPSDRLAFMIEDSAAAHVVTDAAHTARLPRTPHRFLTDQDWPGIEELATDDLEPAAAPHDLAYLIYTSGSTGRPKGVQIEHHSLVNLIHWTVESFGAAPGRRVAHLAGIGFDAAAWELWPALAMRRHRLRPRGHGAAHTGVAAELAGRAAGDRYVPLHAHAGGAGRAGLVGADLAGVRPHRR